MRLFVISATRTSATPCCAQRDASPHADTGQRASEQMQPAPVGRRRNWRTQPQGTNAWRRSRGVMRTALGQLLQLVAFERHNAVKPHSTLKMMARQVVRTRQAGLSSAPVLGKR